MFGEVVFDQAGNLYTTVEQGGAFGEGYVVELTPSGGTWTSTVLHSFHAEAGDGANPYSGLVIDSSGNLYGTTVNGNGGVAFELSLTSSGWTETVLQYFSLNYGIEPYASMVFDPHGNLYGTTVNLGPNGGGDIFEFSPDNGSWTFSIPWAFSRQGGGGDDPYGGVTFDAHGNLWGSTAGTSCCGFGTVYELTPVSGGGWSETVLHYFVEGPDGANPNGKVIFDTQGNAYGVTSRGGNLNACTNEPGCGTLWEVTP